jgi:hypothetical protein
MDNSVIEAEASTSMARINALSEQLIRESYFRTPTASTRCGGGVGAMWTLGLDDGFAS